MGRSYVRHQATLHPGMKPLVVPVSMAFLVACSTTAGIASPSPSTPPAIPDRISLTELQAVKAAQAAMPGPGDPDFPASSGAAPCVLLGGGAPPGTKYAATCETAATQARQAGGR